MKKFGILILIYEYDFRKVEAFFFVVFYINFMIRFLKDCYAKNICSQYLIDFCEKTPVVESMILSNVF